MRYENKINVSIADNLGEGVLVVATHIRSLINDLIFEVFLRSVDHATKRKVNSLILFIVSC